MKRHYELKISVESGQAHIRFKHKISELSVKRKRSKTVNTFYITTFPKELMDFMEVKERSLYFYENKKVYITSIPPEVEYKKIKIKQTNQISIPKTFFNPAGFTSVIFDLNLDLIDVYRDEFGLLSMELE